MLVTILTLIALLFLVIIIGVSRFLYSLTIKDGNLNNSMKMKALDVFIYLGIGISLVVSVTNVLQVIFSAIDRKFADLVSATYYVDVSSSDVRFAIASLVVMFPIYVALSWYVSSDIRKFLYKQDIWIRKAVIYGALFVTILSLVGTLVSVVYTYLGGELTIRFGLKALSVFVVALFVFGYYFYSLKRDYSKKTYVPFLFGCISFVLVTASVVWSITVIGTPSEMRARKIDSTRLSDISRVQQEILNRLQMTDTLPEKLQDLENAFQGYMVPNDPVTKESYEYRVIEQPTFKLNYVTGKKEMVTNGVFELCATFSSVREVNSRGKFIDVKSSNVSSDAYYLATNYYYEGDQSPFWNHKAERTCYKRVITKDMYYGR